MRRLAVESSAARSIGYDARSSTLEVEYSSDGVYRYFDVPPQVHGALMRAESIGTFLNVEIKPRYRYARLS